MEKYYLGIDAGSSSIKGVIINNHKEIIASDYLYIEDEIILTLKKLINNLNNQLKNKKYKIVSIGTTGIARKLVGTILDASIIKNEITSNIIGTTSIYPNANTILDIGKNNLKVIILKKGILVDYSINTLCNKEYLMSKQINNLEILSNNIKPHKSIKQPIIIEGGGSKNKNIIKTIEKETKEKIIVDRNSHLIGALGVAVLALNCGIEKETEFDIENIKIETKNIECQKCNNNCEVIYLCKNDKIIDYWGNKCEKENIVLNN